MRLMVITLAVLCLAIVAILFARHVAPLLVLIHLTLSGIFLLGALLLDRSRYSSTARRGPEAWNPTSERFVDPTTRHLIEVRENPRTGERASVDISPVVAEPQQIGQAWRRGKQ